ncbi:LOW QUALITY PROTEIN: telomere-associated protein RIF1 [Ostrinia furnacalis]|uniref:LOW QUALITY PROTEIN: telomere-associated protein RIF1 n=1 Tax=Ostrinia furnacalis TaxID=93504 RepID=UPI001038B100|nr:LOW QUALITY PROTEIN: telomere-associated protein RIF1 [Ostrinia furnacalis]
MPEETAVDIQRTLELLEDPIMEVPLVRSQHYKVFMKALENGTDVSLPVLNRILALCVVELHEDKKCCLVAIKIIYLILKKIKAEDHLTLPNLVPSITAILNTIKTTALLNNMENLQTLCFETLDLYPNKTLTEVALNSTEIIEVINLYCQHLLPLEIQLLPCSIILKLLKILPPEKKEAFVKANLNVWFSKLIPTIFAANRVDNDLPNATPLDTLELLTDALVAVDYDDNTQWQILMECIYNPQKYPATMKQMLVNGRKNWHRLWIVCIRLLKNQITRIMSKVGSPINSMLPVVETAFKLDVTNRCRAFQCWDVLIDNFHTETNESYIVKRLKLLIIPLQSNNAKVEATALAKMKTWWHLIQKFESRLGNFVETIIISFLHFCFGKQKPGFVPGLLTVETKKQALEMLIALAGHSSCTGCVNVPKLNGKIISTNILIDFLNDWMYSLKVAIVNYKENIGITIKQMTCLWRSFIAIVAELPDNNVRNDIFKEFLAIVQTCIKDIKCADVGVHWIASLFVDQKTEGLLKLQDKQGPIFKMILLLLDQSLSTYYRTCDTKVISNTLKPVASYILDKEIESSSKLLSWLLNLDDTVSQSNISFLLTPLAECVYELEYEDVSNINSLVLWPFEAKNFFVDIVYCGQVWSKLIDYIYPKADDNAKDDIANALWSTQITTNLNLKLQACMVILKHELESVSVVGYTKTVELLMLITNEIKSDIEFSILNMLIKIEKSLLKVAQYEKDKILMDHTIHVAENIFKMLNLFKENEEDKMKMTEDLLSSIEPVFLSNPYHSIVTLVLVDSGLVQTNTALQKRVMRVLEKYSTKIMSTDPAFKIIQDAISKLETTTKKSEQPVEDAISKLETSTKQSEQPAVKGENVTNKKFAEPDVKLIVKKGRKKETSIVNTVVENGEEFVVVKSNWKFNPRKLTENQKEKFQKKREDIPALYQDLSQSQDEFKLATWKTDSQDSSSTSSKSTSASKSTDSHNVTEMLKKMPSSDVVPKIIENIFSEKPVTDVNVEKKSSGDLNKVKQTTTPKDPKSPRMALKDRVFRNVRNLIEKSNGQKDGKDLSESLIQIENIPKTPTLKGSSNNSSNLANSAPPKINSERPSRVKRKPKKFDDVQIFPLKRGRRSSSQNDSSCSPTPPIENELEKDDTSKAENDVLKNRKTENEKSSPTSSQDSSVIHTVAVIENAPSEDKTPLLQCDTTPHVEEFNKLDSAAIITDNNEKNKKMDAEDERQKVSPEQTSSVEVQNNEPVERESDVILLSDNKEVIELSEAKDTPSPPKEEPVKDDSTNKDALVEPISDHKKDLAIINKEENKPSEGSSANDKAKIDKTPKRKQETLEPKLTRRSTVKKSRIEKELAIDTVEGHPFLKIQTEKRMTRKNLNNSMKDTLLNNTRRKSLAEKLNKSKVDAKTTPKTLKKDKTKTSPDNTSVTISESQENYSEISDDLPLSEDVIESSQDSSITTISVKPIKSVLKKVSVMVHKVPLSPSVGPFETQDLLTTNNDEVMTNKTLDSESKDDSILPQNKTAVTDKTDLELTENMDTQPIHTEDIESKDDSNDVIIVYDDDVIVISSETQEIAEADTQPMNPADLIETSPTLNKVNSIKAVDTTEVSDVQMMGCNTEDEITTTINESSVICSVKADAANTASSPFKDEAQRKKDFLNNTLEISPIKTLSPVRDKKSPSPETSSDYVVIKLSSPVQSNGEPFEKCNSPEIFTEDKVSPDKRDLSPPREENASNNNSSPSSSLSLKKNRPQVRSGGRAAQMLGLCVPDRLQTIMNTERSEAEEPKKSPSTTPARRNLRILYNSVGDTSENNDDSENSENFLKFKRSLPTSECSPSGPILKRKLAEITDDATVSSASKRKRVSFHDPPVSTTIAVQKYIEPCGVRSPSNSALKRQERQNLRSQIVPKSPKRLDIVFKLDNALTKTVESFNDSETTSDVTQSMSLDETPAVEIIKHSDMNDVDPICPDLVDCNDPIDNIAAELSSASMKTMFLKELEGQIATVGDFAKKTELEVNRLCIKAPKVKVAKRVLNDYARKIAERIEPPVMFIEPVEKNISPEVVAVNKIDIDTQTFGTVSTDVEIQTNEVPVAIGCVQTDEKIIAHIGAQTDESGVKSTKDLVASCIAERPDFVETLGENLEESAKQRIAERLSFETVTDLFMKNVTNSNTKSLITRILSKHSNAEASSEQIRQKDLSFLQDYISERFDNKDLILFCSQMLAKIHNKS